MSCPILTSLPPKITSCQNFSLSYTSYTLCIYTHYSNITSHPLNFFFNIPPSYLPFSNLLSILLTIQLQSLFFFFILYFPIITNSILFFQLNSLYIHFNYYPIHLYPIIYTNPLIIYFSFNASHQLTLSHDITNRHLLLMVSLFTFLSITLYLCLPQHYYHSQSLILQFHFSSLIFTHILSILTQSIHSCL